MLQRMLSCVPKPFRSKYIGYLLPFFLASAASAQMPYIPGDAPRENFERISIPFEYENDLIILRLIFNNALPLRFIFDTGSEQTILLKREVTDILNIPYYKRLPIIGSDMRSELYALIIRNIHLQISDLHVDNYSMLVLEEDYFRFEEATGVEVQGILGAAVFDRYVIKIDYRSKMLTLIRPESFKPPKDYTPLDLRISRRKPYLDIALQLPDSSTVKKHLLIDTGAGLPLLLHYQEDSTFIPPSSWVPANIGQGLGGYLEGYTGRLRQIKIGPHTITQPLVHYQFLSESTDTSYLNQRDGILGNQLLRRFDLFINYPDKKLYLRPNRYFHRPFKYDKSGLIILAGGRQLSRFLVKAVVPGSPADLAGIQAGDLIQWINGRPAGLWSLQGLHTLFQKRNGKKIRLRVLRKGQSLRMEFRLRELL